MNMMPTKKDILTILCNNQSHIRTLGVRRLGLFGSFLHDQQHTDSDVDLLVEFEPGQKTFDNFMELSFFLEGALRPRVELVTPEALSPYMGQYILDEVEYATFSTSVSAPCLGRSRLLDQTDEGFGARAIHAGRDGETGLCPQH
jgi:hypothetical protein